ncbi:glycosyltransferase [Cyclobacterium plantarum]|uniref:Glycosyltransferase family 4 protein n=1 Tax=Cyclobacterium plantarum TaxID=2716263 RepID=A0ABX0H273_9BACT|nr:glycosyltransferase [Cyclobacterium plantarum]NHE55557.1 glycosyltransferase family 4 protein [Cyclobacterium plantarum]
MTILHLSFDFPDIIHSSKTKAVKNLVNSQEKYDNLVISMNRTTDPSADYSPLFTDSCIAMRVFGMPFGIGLTTWMYFASKRVLRILRSNPQEVTLIHAHKLSFEGIIAFWLSKWLSVPFIVTIRGDSDLKVIKSKKMLRPFYKKILKKASNVVFLAPWTKVQMDYYLKGLDLKNTGILLPNIIDLKQHIIPENVKRKNRFISVFRLDNYRRKNVKRVIKAFDRLHQNYPEVGLDILGPGPEKSRRIIQKFIDSCKYPLKFNILGPMGHDELLNHYGNYMGFVLPSNPETFGMVFIEALNAGLPIIYAKNAGVDGLFDETKIGIKVKSTSVKEISDALKHIYLENQDYMKAVQTLKENNGLKVFSKINIRNAYVDILDKSIY